MAGLGAVEIVGRWPKFAKWLVGISLIEGAASVALMMPVPLSYYSPLVGGLPGATSAGDGADLLLGRRSMTAQP